MPRSRETSPQLMNLSFAYVSIVFFFASLHCSSDRSMQPPSEDTAEFVKSLRSAIRNEGCPGLCDFLGGLSEKLEKSWKAASRLPKMNDHLMRNLTPSFTYRSLSCSSSISPSSWIQKISRRLLLFRLSILIVSC